MGTASGGELRNNKKTTCIYIYLYSFFWRTDDGLRRLFQPGLENKEIGETSPGSCTQKEGEDGIVCGVRGL